MAAKVEKHSPEISGLLAANSGFTLIEAAVIPVSLRISAASFWFVAAISLGGLAVAGGATVAGDVLAIATVAELPVGAEAIAPAPAELKTPDVVAAPIASAKPVDEDDSPASLASEEIKQLEAELIRLKAEEQTRRAEFEAGRLAAENALRFEHERRSQAEAESSRQRAEHEKQRIAVEAREQPGVRTNDSFPLPQGGAGVDDVEAPPLATATSVGLLSPVSSTLRRACRCGGQHQPLHQ